MKKLLLTIFITTLSFNIFAIDLDQKLAGFPSDKVQKYKVYRKNFVKWMDKRKANRGNQAFIKQFKLNMRFLTTHYKDLMMRDAGVTDPNISASELVQRLYSLIKHAEGADAIFSFIELTTPSEDSALGQVLGNREAFTAQLDEAYSGSEDNGASIGL